MLPALAAEGATCSAELEKLSSLLREVQGIVQYGSVNAAAATAAEGSDASLLRQYGADVAALEADGCKLQLVLLPHGKGKAAKGDYARWAGGLDDFKALQDWILEQVRLQNTAESLTTAGRMSTDGGWALGRILSSSSGSSIDSSGAACCWGWWCLLALRFLQLQQPSLPLCSMTVPEVGVCFHAVAQQLVLTHTHIPRCPADSRLHHPAVE